MRRAAAAMAMLVLVAPAHAVSPAAREFMEIARELEPVHCEKRKLRRDIALAEATREAARARELRAKFDAHDRDPRTARLERRLGELYARISNGRGGTLDPADLEAISVQQRGAYLRCE